MRPLALLCLVLLSPLSWADVPCSELERGFERFDNKKSQWVKSSELILMQCGPATRLEFRKGGKQLGGLACGEKSKVARTHVVLSEEIEKPVAVWAVNQKTNTLEAVDLKTITCSVDEP